MKVNSSMQIFIRKILYSKPEMTNTLTKNRRLSSVAKLQQSKVMCRIYN